MWTWFVKFLSGFAFWKAPQIGKILYYSIITILVVFVLWKAFLEKRIVNIENYENCSVKQVAPKECPKEPVFEVLKLWRLRLFSVR